MNDETTAQKLLAACGMTAVFMLGITLLRIAGGYELAAPQADIRPSSSSQQPAEAATLTQAEMEQFIAGCMKYGARLDWVNPLTGEVNSAFCQNYRFPRAKWSDS